MMNTAIILPEEIIMFEILKRLPVKSLCRFRVVSKCWLSTITSRAFTDSHFEISKLNPTRLFGFYYSDYGTTATPKFLIPTLYTRTLDKWDKYYLYCSISPRGLICLYDIYDLPVQIWNPSTGERIEVNPKPLPPDEERAIVNVYFLGFDPISKKHKLLSPGDREHYLLTLGEKNWRKIITTDHDDNNGCSGNSTYGYAHRSIDGIIYYLVKSRDQYEYTNLVAFDVRSERFLETICLPGKVNRFESYIGGRIGVYRGRIVLLNYDPYKDEFETWVLEDVEKQKWSPKRIIPLPPSPMSCKLGVIDGEELVLYSRFAGDNSTTEGFRLCKYDLEKGSWSETRFPADFLRVEKLDGSAMYVVRLYSYVDSLESLQVKEEDVDEEEEGGGGGCVSLN